MRFGVSLGEGPSSRSQSYLNLANPKTIQPHPLLNKYRMSQHRIKDKEKDLGMR